MNEHSVSDTQLKLIAIVVPEPVYSYARAEQEYIAQTWGPRQSLRNPPHITLIPPLQLLPDEVSKLQDIAHEMASTNFSFELKVNGFESFPPRVIFIKPNFPKELNLLYLRMRNAIRASIPNALNRFPDESFHPHITIAYKDVKPEQFKSMWKYYRNKKVRFTVSIDRFCMLDNRDGQWVIEAQYPLAVERSSGEIQA